MDTDAFPIIFIISFGTRDDDVGSEPPGCKMRNVVLYSASDVVDGGEIEKVEGIGICEGGDGLVWDFSLAGAVTGGVTVDVSVVFW